MLQTMLPATLLTASNRDRAKADSMREMAYHTLREKIVTLALPPATLLNEADLMAELDLGRTPIREALQQLALEKLVVILPRRGTIVADVNMQDLHKVFELRLELEAFAVRLAAERASMEEIAAMEALFEQAEAIINSGDYRRLIQLDEQAHRLLARAAHNEFLEETLARLYTQVLRLWHVALPRVGRLSEAIEEHQAILAAIKAGQAEQAAGIMRAHIMAFQSELAKVL